MSSVAARGKAVAGSGTVEAVWTVIVPDSAVKSTSLKFESDKLVSG